MTEDISPEKRSNNIQYHFGHIWSEPPDVDTLDGCMESDQIYVDYELMDLPEIKKYTENLSDGQLISFITNTQAHGFYIRMLLGRIMKLKEQNTIFRQAENDRRGAFETSLGILIEERSNTAGGYLAQLEKKQHMAQFRLSRTLAEARLLRDRVTEAYNDGALGEKLMACLRLKLLALAEHYPDGWRLLGEEGEPKLLNPTDHAWL